MTISLTDGRTATIRMNSGGRWVCALRAEDPIEPMIECNAASASEALDSVIASGLIDGRSLARLRREAAAL